MKNKKKILVIAAHPDDEVLGCGGTIARFANEGHDVIIAILGEGITSRFNDSEVADEKQIKELHNQSGQVANLLGGKELTMYSLPDNRFDTLPILDIIKMVEELIQKFHPSMILTHCAGDLNIDHSITHRAVLTATRAFKNQPVNELYTFEVPSSTEWSFGQFNGTFNPNYFIDINSTLNKKLEAMEIYDGELRSYPHPRSLEALTALAKYRGSISGLILAEGFEVVRIIKR